MMAAGPDRPSLLERTMKAKVKELLAELLDNALWILGIVLGPPI
jgi:hypothetical protein